MLNSKLTPGEGRARIPTKGKVPTSEKKEAIAAPKDSGNPHKQRKLRLKKDYVSPAA